MPDFAYDRVRSGRAMPGVFVVSDRMPVGQVIDELLLTTGCSEPSEWEGIVLYFPL
jgi:hypothetical protein